MYRRLPLARLLSFSPTGSLTCCPTLTRRHFVPGNILSLACLLSHCVHGLVLGWGGYRSRWTVLRVDVVIGRSSVRAGTTRSDLSRAHTHMRPQTHLVWCALRLPVVPSIQSCHVLCMSPSPMATAGCPSGMLALRAHNPGGVAGRGNPPSTQTCHSRGYLMSSLCRRDSPSSSSKYTFATVRGIKLARGLPQAYRGLRVQSEGLTEANE
ncbi:uncharacterized protein B0H18DRAFT_542804 [Fomitopsis serialis]|uniref:uncharacterized protein n=1 Tax=Fomitopsis serialis TaxID=139415 RepID=UPI002008C5DD|nr:uncharacterized protein B0H18DRAFT_542804 [Neoantrodia serialis]KAH9921642.1 hypothetical protein B0H18DRAFT_542804 [Neoantrodia serialis]